MPGLVPPAVAQGTGGLARPEDCPQAELVPVLHNCRVLLSLLVLLLLPLLSLLFHCLRATSATLSCSGQT